ncbi:MAG: glycosyltransferase [Bacteroidota bacterium]
MKIVLINSIGKHKWGGGEKWMIMAAKGLMSLGHDVVAIARKDSLLAQKAHGENIPVKYINTNSDFDLYACFKFCSFFKEFPPDVVIGCQNKDWRVASLALKLTGVKAKVYSRQGLQLLKNHWWYKCSVKMLCDGIITNTYTIKKEYEKFLPVEQNFIKVIFNGVEPVYNGIEGFNYSSFIPGAVKNPLVVLSTGRLAYQKGFRYLIDAAAMVIKENPHVFFFLAGQGKLESILRERIEDLGISKNFILLGFVEDVHSLLKNADIFVLTSLYEGMPNSILEAMVHGLPIVSTRVNGVSELIEDGVNGYTIDSKNIQKIYSALDHLVNDEQRRAEFGQKAREYVSSEFSVKRMVQDLDQYLKSDI